MAHFDVTRTQTGTFAGPSKLIARLAAWNHARRTRITLNKLSNRELDDIGLSRADIDGLK